MKLNLRTTYVLASMVTLGLLFSAGCGKDKDTAGSDGDGAMVPLPADLFVATAPEGVQTVSALKQSSKEGDEVVVRVVVGGGDDPVSKGRAVATVMDAGLANKCTSDEDNCKTPWDYCCTPNEDKVTHGATLRVVDADGRALAADLSERIKPLSTLTVRGVVGPRANDDVLMINATAIYIEAPAP